MWDIKKRNSKNIMIHIVDIGERKIKVPVAILGEGKGKTVLITAGMDGDEYSGIEAAYRLITYFQKVKSLDQIIILPIINIPGFEKAVSINPIDKKYPKHIFPGRKNGSATEKLMYWVSENFAKKSDLWIDLHSGASTETLDPFVWAWQTKEKTIQNVIAAYLSKLKAERIVFHHTPRNFTEAIAKKKTSYILLEAGEMGKREKEAIQQHMSWVTQLVIPTKSQKLKKHFIYESVEEIVALSVGIWVPLFFGKAVQKGKVLGEVRSLDGKILQKVIAKHVGVFLYRREAMYCQKGDDLYAYAHNKERLKIKD